MDGANMLNADGPQLDVDVNASEQVNEEAAGAESASPVKEEDVPEEFEEEDPLFGLEKRMKVAKIDDEMKGVIKAKLIDAQNKVKEQLKERQT